MLSALDVSMRTEIEHFVFKCPLCHNIRQTMFYYNRDFDLKTVLFDRNDNPSDINIKLVEPVHEVLTAAKRFDFN